MEEGYGQHYESMYTGSMIGAGALMFALMGYIIAKTRPRTHTIDLNPTLLAAIFGESEKAIERTIERLCSPDPKSRSTVEEGRRLLRRGQFEYYVVNHEHYRGLASKERRRKYMAEFMAKKRGEDSLLTGANTMLTTAKTPASASASASVQDSRGVGEKGISTSERISIERELHRLDKRLKELGHPQDYDRGSPERAEIRTLKEHRPVLLAKLGAKA